MWYYLALSTVILIADQAAKIYMSRLLPLCTYESCKSIEVLPVFKLMMLHNTGAAFSFLDDAGGWQRWFLVTISLGVSVAIGVWLSRIYQEQKLLACALAFVLGGALGNLVDRVLQGYVVDFLVFHYEGYYFPAFNIADSAITVGAGLLILDMFRHGSGDKENG